MIRLGVYFGVNSQHYIGWCWGGCLLSPHSESVPDVQDHTLLCNKFEASPGYMKPCLKKQHCNIIFFTIKYTNQ